MTQRNRLIVFGGWLGGLDYVLGGGLWVVLFDFDAIIIAWWAALLYAPLVVFAWLRWLRNDNA